MAESEEIIQQLLEKSLLAKSRAYCSYSEFPVGAALLTEDGTIFTGCNVENAVLNCGTCAEVTAISKAVSEGFRKFRAILITSNLEDYLSPCGQCRQVMAEFNTEISVYMTNGKREIMCRTLRELLPCGIGSDLLAKSRTN